MVRISSFRSYGLVLCTPLKIHIEFSRSIAVVLVFESCPIGTLPHDLLGCLEWVLRFQAVDD